MNALFAIWNLTCYQFFNRKKIISTLLTFIAPSIIAYLISRTTSDNATESYSIIVNQVLISIVIPFSAFYWGSSLLTDEIDNKTLVYLWTRPNSRQSIVIFKFLCIIPFIILLTTLSLITAYLSSFGGIGIETVFSELGYVLWDSRALILAGIVYAALGSLVSSLFKKPLAWGLFYIFFWDPVVSALPGSLKLLSVRYYTLNLSTHPERGQLDFPIADMLKMLKPDSPPSAIQSILTLIIAAIFLVTFTAYRASQKEYASDDPARV